MIWFNVGGVRFPSSAITLYNEKFIQIGHVAQIPISGKQFLQFDKVMTERVIGKSKAIWIPRDEKLPTDEEVHTGSQVPGIATADTRPSPNDDGTAQRCDGSGSPDVPGGLVPPTAEDIATAEDQLRHCNVNPQTSRSEPLSSAQL